MSAYRFRRFTADDLPLAAGWLKTPEVVRWWGDPAAELALLAEDLHQPLMAQYIVEYRGRPFAYAQAYSRAAWPQIHLEHLPRETKMVDALIGEPDMLGRGHGSAFLREFAQLLIAEGAPLVAIDPDAANERARHAYARAGFAGSEIANAETGPVVVMVFRD